MLKLIFARQTVARPYAAPPGLPEDRVKALRTAFDETMKDPAFLAEAKQTDLEVRPVSGDEVQRLVDELYRSSPEVIKVAADSIKGAN